MDKEKLGMGITGRKNKKRAVGDRKEVIVKESFVNSGKELINNVDKANDEVLLNSTIKSLGLPAAIWCEFQAMLHVSNHDYTYEFLQEMLSDYYDKKNLEYNGEYLEESERLKRNELRKIKKKQSKNSK